MNKRLLLLLPLIIAALFLAPSIPRAHAATGLVCITSSATAISCPVTPPSLGPFPAGSNFTVGVFIQGSDAMGGFDIYVKSDPAFVNPVSASLGSLITSPTLTAICVNGVSQIGACTVGSANGPGVVEVTTIENTGGNECGGLSPCSGMAFTIIYRVVAASNTALSYPTATGCSTSSVSSPPNTCVLVDDAVGTVLPETVQAATITQNTTPDFSITATPNHLTVNPGSSVTSRIDLTSINALTGNIVFTTTRVPGCLVPCTTPTWNINPSRVLLPPGGTNSSTLLFATNSTTLAGVWNVVVNGTFVPATPIVGRLPTHVVTVTFTIVLPGSVPDYTVNANPTSLTIPLGSSATSTITLTSINGFSGTVVVSSPVSVNCSPCNFWFVTQPNVTLTSGGTATTTLVVNAANQVTAETILVYATTVGHFHSTNVTLTVTAAPADFNLNAYPSYVEIPAGSTATSTVQVNRVMFGGAAFNVTLTVNVSPPNGPTVTLNPSIVTISSNQFGSYSTLTIFTQRATPPGNYTVTILGLSGTLVHNTTVAVEVLPPPTVTLTPTSGPIGTKVLVQASGFPIQYGSIEILANFDDQLIGLEFTSTSSFNFTFNVPEAQAGPHTVNVVEPGFGSGLGTITGTAPFQVTPTPTTTSFSVSVDIGAIYFPGDTATSFILVTRNGQPVSPTDLQLTVQLVKSDGTTQSLASTKLTTGVYSAIYTIPTTGTNILGTYAITVKAHSSSLGDSAALSSFEVKPTWLSKNAGTITTGTAIAGVAGFGAVGLAWKKGYLKKKDDELIIPA